MPRVSTEAPGVRVCRTIKPWNWGPLWGLTYMQQVGRWMKRLRRDWDICLCRGIYLHSAVAARVARKLNRPLANIPAAAGSHGDLRTAGRSLMMGTLLPDALKVDAHFSLSSHITSELTRAGVPPATIHPFRNPVDLSRFSPSGEHDASEFLYLGRFDEQKNIPLLLDAFARVYTEHPEARLRLVGDGPDRGEIVDRVRNSPARGAITVEPWTDDPASAYRKALALVLPSWSEGLSNTLIEALACGTPCIATRVSGTREALGLLDENRKRLKPGGLVEGAGGLACAPGDATGLARAMVKILTSPQLRARYSEQGLAHVRTHFDENAVLGKFIATCEELLAARQGARRP